MMHNLQTLIENYLEYCGTQKRLDEKTLNRFEPIFRMDFRPGHYENHLGNIRKPHRKSSHKVQAQNSKAENCLFESLFSLS